MEIRKYKETDKEQVIYVCLNDMIKKNFPQNVIDYVEWMFSRYYVEKEPDVCYVIADDNDKAVGYIYGSKDYDYYQENFGEYIRKVASLNNRAYLGEALTEMFDHAIYKDKYPAHLHIDILPEYQSMGFGSNLINAFCENLKNLGVKGVMLIVGEDNEGARRFYERNGFSLLQTVPTGCAYGKVLLED